jgi:hypothetical protein
VGVRLDALEGLLLCEGVFLLSLEFFLELVDRRLDLIFVLGGKGDLLAFDNEGAVVNFGRICEIALPK